MEVISNWKRSAVGKLPFQTQDPGVLTQDPGVLTQDPGVLREHGGVPEPSCSAVLQPLSHRGRPEAGGDEVLRH